MSPSDPPVDFRALFDSAPELFLAVRAEEDYRIAAASDPYLRATMTRREDIVGRPLFEVFPANPGESGAASRQQLHAALDHVRAGGPAETLPERKYDLRRPEAEGGGFDERYWETSAAPVRGSNGTVEMILCRTEDVTARMQSAREMENARSRMEATLGSADVGTWIWEVGLDRVSADRNLARLFGVSEEDAAAGPLEHYTRHIHEDDRSRVAEAIDAATREGRRFDTEYRIRQPDGSIRWVAARGWAEKDADGTPTRFPGVVIDITERKRAEEAALRHSRQLQKLSGISTRLNAAHDVTSVLGIITEEARSLIGAQRAVTSVVPGLAEERAVTVMSRQDSERATGCLYRASAGDAPMLADLAERLHGPMRVSREEAAHAPALRDPSAAGLDPAGAAAGWLAAPLVGRNTRRLGVIHLADKPAQDFTADDESLLAQLAQIAGVAIENARLYEELREKDQRKDEFLAMLAHELRNPLAAIRNAVALGSDQEAKAEEIEWSMEVINRQMRQLSRLIDDLLDVSRITQGKVQLRREALDAARVLQSAVDTVQPLMEERQHELTVSFRPGTLHLEADPTRLEQIIVNLLANAAKYTEKGGEISLRAKVEDGQVVIRIKDNGVGIPPEKLPLMFELFTQGNRSLARSEGGLGIGLTIVRSLAELHGGSVTASSEGLGTGSEFVVRLPAMAAANGSSVVSAQFGKTRAALKPSAVARPVAAAAVAHRILVVDDNADSAHGTAKILSRQGHDVRIVYDGPSALAAAREHQPRYVLLDIGLPGMDGYEVATRLRQEEKLKDATLIAVSGYGQDSDRRRSREAGFDQHLVKPVDPEELLALLA